MPALHRALGVAAFFGRGAALLLQRGTSGFQRDDGVGQLGLVLRGQEGKQRRVVRALGPGFCDDGLFLGLPAVLDPQIQALVVVLGQNFVVGGGQTALDVVLALHDANLLEHIAKAGLEQVGAFLLHTLGRCLEFGFLGTEFVVPGARLTGLQAVFGTVAPRQSHHQAVLVLQFVQQRR